MAERTMPRGSMCLRINRLSSTGRTWNGSILFTIVVAWYVILSFRTGDAVVSCRRRSALSSSLPRRSCLCAVAVGFLGSSSFLKGWQGVGGGLVLLVSNLQHSIKENNTQHKPKVFGPFWW
jgi:hypothetical protein